MRSLAPGFCVALLLAAPPTVSGQETYLLTIGINDYIAFDDEPGGDLLGAESDALLVRDVLTKRFGIPEENVQTLLSREATKAAIEQAITGWLAQVARPGDVVVLYYAGHGAQALDLDGDEPDGLDETIAPSDVLKLSSDRDIRDDELRKWLAEVRGELVVILDSCHSGSATRGTGSMRGRMLDRDIPDEVGFEPGPIRQRYDAESMADGSRTVLEIAAAAPNQWAVEGDFPTSDGASALGGAFTYHLVRELWRAAPAATYGELFGRVVAHLKSAQFEQDPQIEGPVDRPLFAAAASKALVPMPVLASRMAMPDWVRPAEPSLSVDVSALPGELRAGLAHALEGIDGVALVEAPDAHPDLRATPAHGGDSIEVLGRDGGQRARVPAGPTAAHALAAVVRKERALRGLAALDDPTSPFAVELSLARAGGTLAPGQTLELVVRSERAGHLTLVGLAPDGALRVLHPLPGGENATLPAGRPVVLRGDGSGYEVGGTGLGMVLAVVTPEPLSVIGPGGAPARREAPDLLSALRRALDAPAGWGAGTSLLAYRVSAGG